MLIVQGAGPSIFGRNWLSKIILEWRTIHSVAHSPIQALSDRYFSIFKEGLGTLQGYKAKIYIDPGATPKFCRAKNVPYALREKVDTELKRLVEEGTIEPVEISNWVAPIVPVLKRDKSSVRLCGDFRLTINPVSKLNKLSNTKSRRSLRNIGKYFTKKEILFLLIWTPFRAHFELITDHKPLLGLLKEDRAVNPQA